MKRIVLMNAILLTYWVGLGTSTLSIHLSTTTKQKNQPVYLKATGIMSLVSASEGTAETGKGYAEMFTLWIGTEGTRFELADRVHLNLMRAEMEEGSYTLYPSEKLYTRAMPGESPDVVIPTHPPLTESKGMVKVRTDHYMGYKCEVMRERVSYGLGMSHALGLTEVTGWFTTIRSHRLGLRTIISVYDASGKPSRMFVLDVVQVEALSKVPEGIFSVPANYRRVDTQKPDGDKN